MNMSYLTQAFKNIEMAKHFLNSGDKKTAKVLHDLAQICIKKYNDLVEMSKRVGDL